MGYYELLFARKLSGGGGGGSSIDVEPLSVTQNGTYTAQEGTAYSPVNVNVPGITIDELATNSKPSGAITLGDSITDIGEYALAGKPITNIYAPSVTVIHQHSFTNTSLTKIDDSMFPKLGKDVDWAVLLTLPTTCTSIELTGEKIMLKSGSGALRNNTGLVTVKLPNAGKSGVAYDYDTTGNFFMASCTNLELADIGYVKNIAANGFNGDTKLTTLIIRRESVCALTNASAFTNTPFKSGGTGGTIYIPKVLYDHLGDGTSNDYQHATNWSTVYGYGTITWAKIEGSIYE